MLHCLDTLPHTPCFARFCILVGGEHECFSVLCNIERLFLLTFLFLFFFSFQILLFYFFLTNLDTFYLFQVVLFPNSSNCLVQMPWSAEDLRQIIWSFLELFWLSFLLFNSLPFELYPPYLPFPSGSTSPTQRDSVLHLGPPFL